MSQIWSEFESHELFIDTTAFVAIADQSEQNNYERAIEFYRIVMGYPNIKLVTSGLVFAETAKHLQRMVWKNLLPLQRLEEFVDLILRSSRISLYEVDDQIRRRGWEISKSRSAEKVDIVDGTSLAIMEQHSILNAFTFDTHFSTTFLKGRQPILINCYP